MSFGPTSTAVKKSGGDLNSDVPLTLPPGDAISALSWSPVANFLAAASWDNTVRVYDVSGHLQGTPRAGINFEGPVLSCDWSRVRRPCLLKRLAI
jgi:mRNA export factor